ncbi:iron complex outermembrane recepter protein [Rhodoblastus acidophilus]|uniref:Iron complex outermembrane recepter protein n=1 Tax=Rhodoblastus acidophilus TaxID=1074 RepID=A0A212S6Y1_RHOAC|nr:TonB-dependent receptor [Rhodoblastus acidophilus]PPQ37265.1 TonB-dependent receptor [Rhodoblastus acidophilus]RAI19061.1 TonB-dependent receptor [Rhodoblastus acidophilus]SNB80887.1 iron complex outermembrane recepter protein [Rhodoblastus acidophilus]
MTKTHSRRALAALLPLALPVSAAFAEDKVTPPPSPVATPATEATVADVVIHAEKKEEKAQEAPISLTAVSGAALETTAVHDSLTLAQAIPGLQAETTSGATNPRYRIRGIGTNDFSANMIPAVGVSEDDVFLDAGSAQGVPIYDLNDVEVLRGPQGTLQGKNTTAGTINYYTKRPTADFEGYSRTTIGDYGRRGEEAAISGPLIQDKLLGRFSFTSQGHDGQFNDLYRNRTVGGQRYWDARGQLQFFATDDLTMLLKLHAGDNKTDVPLRHVGLLAGGLDAQGYAQAPGSNVLANNGSGDSFNRRAGVSLNTRYHFPNDWTLTNIFAYESSKFSIFSDDDASPAPLNYEERIAGRSNVVSNELRLASPEADPVRFIGGLYYLDNQTNSNSQQPLYSPLNFGLDGNAYNFNISTRDIAAFSSLSADLTDKLTLTVGGRLTHERRSASGEAWSYVTDSAAPLDTSARNLTYINTGAGLYVDPATGLPITGPALSTSGIHDSEDVTLKYKLTPDDSVYARFARGFRSGNYNTYVATASDFALYEPEILTDYEAGVKTLLWDGRLQLNLSGFHYDYQNMQVTILQNTGTTTTNAASAVSDGFELEGKVRPLEDVTVNFGVTYQNAHYVKFTNASAPYPVNLGNPIDLSGQPFERAPKVSANLGVTYHIPVSFGSFDLSTDWRYTSRYRFQAWSDATNVTPAPFLATPAAQVLIRNSFSQGDLLLGNIRIAWHSPDEKTEIAAWVHNVTDRAYNTNAFGMFFNRSITQYPGERRFVGLELTQKF